MPTVISALSSHRNMPSQAQHYTYYTTSPHPSNSSARRSSGPRDDDRYTVASNRNDDRRFSTYTPTTVSSYQRRTAIDGLPGPEYFSSGQSKSDRRREYVQRPTPPTSTLLSEGLRAASKELVKYRECEVYDSDDEDSNGRERRRRAGEEYDDFDDRTVKPEDSISQVSYPAFYSPSSRSSVPRGRRRRRDSGIDIQCDRELGYGGAGGYGSGSYSSSSGRGGGSTFSDISTFQSEKVFDGTRQCWLVERRPRASAMGRLAEVR